jgi:hypothetical protein
VVVFVLLVLLDYEGLCGFLVFLGFLCFCRKTLQKGYGGGEPAARVAGGKTWRASVFLSFFEARFALFRRPLADTYPPTLLAAVLWFSHCLLRLKGSPVIGTWSSRARVFFTPWATRESQVLSLLPCLVVPGGLWCSAAAWDLPVAARVLHKPSPVVFSSNDSFYFGCFLVFDSLLCVRFSLVITS